MSKTMTYKETKAQSTTVYNQFGEKLWIPNAKKNVLLPHKNPNELKSSGVGKFLLSCAMGASLEGHVEMIKKHRHKVDILTCDKGFAALLDHGIKADFVMICDAGVKFEWLKGYAEQTKGVKLLSTPYANPEWTHAWKGDIYYFINKDSIATEKVFMEIMGKDIRQIPAGSNVSNAMLIFFMGCEERSAVNWSGYESILLTGYDYSWMPKGNYYAWANPTPKRYYMNHITCLDINKDWVFTSVNLHFSARWMHSYTQAYDMPIVNCSGRGLLPLKRMGNLEEYLEKINKSRFLEGMIRKSYENVTQSRIAFENAMKLFNQSREGLLQWQ